MTKKIELTKEQIYPFLDEYYKSIGRQNPPPFRNYSLGELKKCLTLFNINLQQEIIQDK
jgi:hypothetical protein